MKTWLSLPLCLIGLTFAAAVEAQDRAPYLDPAQPIEKRVEDLLGRMSIEEKVSLIHGDSKFSTAAIPRLGVPRRWLSDGPHGVREDVGPHNWNVAGRTDDFATAMPALCALGCGWNLELARAYGDVLGQEARARNKDIILGPIADIARTPLCGRIYEFLGEDPFLNTRLSVEYIRGVQAQDVAACIKHFVGNNQELGRLIIDMDMDDRALREIYMPPFEAAVKEAGVWAVMGAYPKFRGQHCAHNEYLINQVLKGEWGFAGVVVSDWGGTFSTREAALNGLDIEMGTLKLGSEEGRPYEDYYLANPFLDGLRGGEYPMTALDDKVRRSLRVMFALHVFDTRKPGALNTPAHQQTAQRVAEEGIVLLKNKAIPAGSGSVPAGELLPLNLSSLTSIAVIGENAVRRQANGFFGAGIKAMHEITPLEGIVQRAGDRVNVTYSVGYSKQGGSNLIERAVSAARQADVAIVIAGLGHARYLDDEGWDRKDLRLPYGQDELIQRVVQANPRTVVVLIAGPALELDSWLGQVPALLQAWYPGMEGGSAIARVLFGDVNPSGKLTCSYPKRLIDSPAHALDTYPGTNGMLFYKEGLLVGYRWFDTRNIQPLFPFGYGLSYTRFEYSALKLVEGAKDSPLTVELDLANCGSRAGAEVVQVYVHQASPRLDRPAKELKGFQKVLLKPNQKQRLSIPLDRRALAYYDPAEHGWVSEKGAYTILVGASSRDIRLQADYTLPATSVEK
jgi:beta-glucosidase